MSFLQANSSEVLAARITDYGRKKIAQGNFNVAGEALLVSKVVKSINAA